MSLLWTQAMPWIQRPKDPKYTPVPVRKAGFAGYVTGNVDDDVYGLAMPKPTPSEVDHFRKYDAVPSTMERRHEEAMDHYRTHGLPEEERADHEDPRLFHFMEHHYHHGDLFEPASVDTTETPIYATQTHVAKEHLDKYRRNADASPHDADAPAPVLITHQGRVHAADGHHRLSAAMERGDRDLQVWHLNLDNLHMPDYDGEDE